MRSISDEPDVRLETQVAAAWLSVLDQSDAVSLTMAQRLAVFFVICVSPE